MTLILPNTIEPLTPADAAEVQQNYAVTQQYINAELINRQGSVAMTGQLTLVGDPVDSRHAASKGYVDSFLPVGVVFPFAGAVAPAGSWALCNGAALPTETYPELFAVLGYRYGGSAALFNLPNLNGRVPIGADAAQTRFDTTGKSGGTWAVPLLQHNHPMPHSHSVTHDHPNINTTDNVIPQLIGEFTAHADPGSGGNWFARRASDDFGAASVITESGQGGHHHQVNVPSSTVTSGPSSAANTSNAGTAAAEHLPPYIVLNYIIRVD